MVVLAAGLRLPNLTRSYWVDEGISVGIASHRLTEIPALLRRGIGKASKVPEIEEVFGEETAIVHALDTLQPGDLLLILVDAVDASLALVRRLLEDRATVSSTTTS